VIDLDQIIDTTPTIPDAGYYEFAKVLVNSPNISCLLISPVPETHMISTVTGEVGKMVGKDFELEENSFAKLMKKLLSETTKPIVFTIESGWKFDPLRKYLIDLGAAVFPQSDRAARALNNVAKGLLGWTGK